MQSNPLHFLTDRQLQALAGLEGLTVPQILAKYRNFRTKEASPTRSGNKAPQSKAAQAMRMLHSGEASSLQEAWDLVRGRKVVRGTRLKNPGYEGSYPLGEGRVRIPGAKGRALRLAARRKMQEEDEAREAASHRDIRFGSYPLGEGRVRISKKTPGYEGLTEAQINAAKAMRLYHSGQASSLQEAWDIVKSGRR